MTRLPIPLMHSLMLGLGLLPPLPERSPRVVGGSAERSGELLVGDQRVQIEEGDTAEDIQGRIAEAIPLRPRPAPPAFLRYPETPPLRPRSERADPERKARRKAQKKARRKGRS